MLEGCKNVKIRRSDFLNTNPGHVIHEALSVEARRASTRFEIVCKHCRAGARGIERDKSQETKHEPHCQIFPFN